MYKHLSSEVENSWCKSETKTTMFQRFKGVFEMN